MILNSERADIIRTSKRKLKGLYIELRKDWKDLSDMGDVVLLGLIADYLLEVRDIKQEELIDAIKATEDGEQYLDQLLLGFENKRVEAQRFREEDKEPDWTKDFKKIEDHPVL